MKESLNDAKEELKRVDHLLFVSLKYTRTVDVILNTINRMIQAYDRLIETLLRKAKEEGEIEEIPEAPKRRVSVVKDLHPDDETVQDNVDLYDLLRKIHRSKHEREREYRRHVTLRTYVDGREEIVNIDICEEYYEFLQDFYDYVEAIVEEATDDDE
ncbi:MAG: hypothetical protein ABEI52_10405 [Halobacteriaceae archaeon]